MKNYHQYMISRRGKVYLNGQPHPTKTDKEGNVRAYLRINGDGKAIRVAQVVCRLYKDVPENHKAVIFKDGDKSNITLDNMVTMTTSNAGKHHSRKSSPPVTTSHSNKSMPYPEKSIMTASWK